jgi:glycosidase
MLRFKLTVVVLLSFVAAYAGEWPPAPPLSVVPDADPGRLPSSVQAGPAGAGRWRCSFRYRPDGTARTVALAGTFNGWNRDLTPLGGPDADGYWSASLDLPAGVHEYKFVVDGERWVRDPENSEGVNDNHNGQNSVLRLGRLANLKTSPGRTGDGQIDGLALEHDPAAPLYLQRLAQDRVLLRVRTLAHDVEGVSVSVQDGATAALTLIDEGPVFALWEGVATGVQPGGGRYTFVLTDGSLQVSTTSTFGVPMTAELFRTPEWTKHAIWYQIFPERFRNGDPANDRDPLRPWTSEWFTPSPFELRDGQTFYKHFVFHRHYGGDLAGIVEKLPYLRELGVNALYLNPVFQAESNHKYDATNYLHIDEHFGVKGDYEAVAAQEDLLDPKTWRWTDSDRRFLEFIKQAHALGFKVIIDGVFNHVGTRHPAFQDVKTSGRDSKYAEWFNITSWKPFKYEGWAGVDSLPAFKKDPGGFACPAVKEHIFNVTRRWLDPDGDSDPRDGIDGWRLDVPNEVPAPFWVEWRQLVKSVNPDAYIVGEIWDRAGPWLDGRHFDAVMNYEFARAVVGWVFDRKLKLSVSDFDRRLRELRLAYPLEATLVLQNLMNSHDTDRLASMAHNPDRRYDDQNRVQDNGPNYDNSRPTPAAYARAKLAALVQMTYLGAPMIYYGDEVGMWGADDPTCRKPMLWKDLEPYEQPDENYAMEDHLTYYRRIVALRNAHPALRTGTLQTLLTDDAADVWAFLRRDENEALLVAVNASDREAEVTVPMPASAPTRWHGLHGTAAAFQVTEQRLTVRVPAVGGIILHARTAR